MLQTLYTSRPERRFDVPGDNVPQRDVAETWPRTFRHGPVGQRACNWQADEKIIAQWGDGLQRRRHPKMLIVLNARIRDLHPTVPDGECRRLLVSRPRQ